MWECRFLPFRWQMSLDLSPIEMERASLRKILGQIRRFAFISDMNWETGRFHVDS